MKFSFTWEYQELSIFLKTTDIKCMKKLREIRTLQRNMHNPAFQNSPQQILWLTFYQFCETIFF